MTNSKSQHALPRGPALWLAPCQLLERRASPAAWGLQWVPKHRSFRSAATSADNCKRHWGCCKNIQGNKMKGNNLLWKGNSPEKLGTQQPWMCPSSSERQGKNNTGAAQKCPTERGQRSPMPVLPSTDFTEIP